MAVFTGPAQTGLQNFFPVGQCTYWASENFHILTGIWVPKWGNAFQWSQAAQQSGWNVSSNAPTQTPSIVVLQPGVQGADPQLGHVGSVEKVNSDGSIVMSSMNWKAGSTILNYAGFPVTEVTIKPGPGVSFISYPNGTSADMTGGSSGANAGPANDLLNTAPGVASGVTGWIGTFWNDTRAALVSFGEHIAIFVIAIILLIVGFMLLRGKGAQPLSIPTKGTKEPDVAPEAEAV